VLSEPMTDDVQENILSVYRTYAESARLITNPILQLAEDFLTTRPEDATDLELAYTFPEKAGEMFSERIDFDPLERFTSVKEAVDFMFVEVADLCDDIKRFYEVCFEELPSHLRVSDQFSRAVLQTSQVAHSLVQKLAEENSAPALPLLDLNIGTKNNIVKDAFQAPVVGAGKFEIDDAQQSQSIFEDSVVSSKKNILNVLGPQYMDVLAREIPRSSAKLETERIVSLVEMMQTQYEDDVDKIRSGLQEPTGKTVKQPYKKKLPPGARPRRNARHENNDKKPSQKIPQYD